eukprot:9279694-Pyramimonas_sp.AAC.1
MCQIGYWRQKRMSPSTSWSGAVTSSTEGAICDALPAKTLHSRHVSMTPSTTWMTLLGRWAAGSIFTVRVRVTCRQRISSLRIARRAWDASPVRSMRKL